MAGGKRRFPKTTHSWEVSGGEGGGEEKGKRGRRIGRERKEDGEEGVGDGKVEVEKKRERGVNALPPHLVPVYMHQHRENNKVFLLWLLFAG